jgi:hypothetical protein
MTAISFNCYLLLFVHLCIRMAVAQLRNFKVYYVITYLNYYFLLVHMYTYSMNFKPDQDM